MTDANALERLISQAKTAIQEGNVDRAMGIFNTVIEADPNHAEAHLMRGAAYSRMRQPKRALPDLDRAVELGGENFIAAYQQRSLIHKALGNEDAYHADLRHVVRRRADYAIKQDDIAEALRLYDQFLGILPDDVEALNARALLHFQKGNYTGALDDYNHILRVNPRDAEAYSNRSVLQMGMGKSALALIDINRAIQLQPDAPAYRHRAHIHLMLDDAKAALADARQALKLEPRSPESYRIRAEVHHALGLSQRALADIRRYETLSHDTQYFVGIKNKLNQNLHTQVDEKTAQKVEALLEEAEDALDQEQTRKAERSLQQALKLAPRYAPLYITLGDAHRQQEQYGEAKVAYDRALELNPDAVGAYYGRALVYLNRKDRDPQSAVTDLDHAIDLDPKDLAFYRLRGMAKSYSPRAEDRREATEDFKYYLLRGGGQEYGDGHQIQKLINDLKNALEGDVDWQG